MQRIVEDRELDGICGGGNTISGTFVNAITGVIRILYDAGKAVGSSIRRIQEGELCPLK